MSAIIDKALDYLESMNTSSSAPHPVDEGRAKELFKFLKELGQPISRGDIQGFGTQNGWNAEFTKKMADWADKVAAGGRVQVKHPGYLSENMQAELRSLLE
ncbi:uncharacterized protein DUF1889 [Pantoea allii]|uniref:Uncharacterized protein DUF1889 n=1 Tax=Pantoea allii TaxID=574096 RepID=A0A2V2BD48_9GAMM|nr:DUF1889 family protein [Pantoea allii]PWK98454.1 uncharacterized protein DUF1889 [Pantoea allii]